MIKDDIDQCVRLIDTAILQITSGHSVDARTTLISVRRMLGGAEVPELLKKKPTPDVGSSGDDRTEG